MIYMPAFCQLLDDLTANCLILADECGRLLATRNRAVVIKRCTASKVLNQFIIIVLLNYIFKPFHSQSYDL